jgi:hypothetical protein
VTLGAIGAVCAAACGLDKGGLLDLGFGDGGGIGGDDATTSADGGGDGATADVDFDAPPEAPPDATPAPIVWDGGMVADPSFSDADWISFCVGLVGCGELGSISRCMGRLRQPHDRNALYPPLAMVRCVVNAGSDCTMVAGCLGDGSQCNAPDSCDANGDLVTCRWGFKSTVDCGSLGMVCSPGIGNAGCGFGDCNAWQQGQTTCVGQWEVACDHGRYDPRLDCLTWGAACNPAIGRCVGNGGACSGSPTCTGGNNMIQECLGGRIATFDCTNNMFFGPGFHCFTDDAGAPSCELGTQCDPSYGDWCEGSNGHHVYFCNAGATGGAGSFDCFGNQWAGNPPCQGGKCTN